MQDYTTLDAVDDFNTRLGTFMGGTILLSNVEDNTQCGHKEHGGCIYYHFVCGQYWLVLKAPKGDQKCCVRYINWGKKKLSEHARNCFIENIKKHGLDLQPSCCEDIQISDHISDDNTTPPTPIANVTVTGLTSQVMSVQNSNKQFIAMVDNICNSDSIHNSVRSKCAQLAKDKDLAFKFEENDAQYETMVIRVPLSDSETEKNKYREIYLNHLHSNGLGPRLLSHQKWNRHSYFFMECLSGFVSHPEPQESAKNYNAMAKLIAQFNMLHEKIFNCEIQTQNNEKVTFYYHDNHGDSMDLLLNGNTGELRFWNFSRVHCQITNNNGETRCIDLGCALPPAVRKSGEAVPSPFKKQIVACMEKQLSLMRLAIPN